MLCSLHSQRTISDYRNVPCAVSPEAVPSSKKGNRTLLTRETCKRHDPYHNIRYRTFDAAFSKGLPRAFVNAAPCANNSSLSPAPLLPLYWPSSSVFFRPKAYYI
jgi:hypothetical protein